MSAGEESAFELKRMLKARELRADERRRGETEFYVSDRVEDFERIGLAVSAGGPAPYSTED